MAIQTEEWLAQPDQAVRDKLIEVAQAGQTITYSEVARIAEIDTANRHFAVAVCRVVERIDRIEHEAHRPLFCPLVVLKKSRKPGTGFYDLARELGLLVGDDDEAVWKRELARTHAYYRTASDSRR